MLAGKLAILMEFLFGVLQAAGQRLKRDITASFQTPSLLSSHHV
jgi:hypothetical protein